MRDPSISLCLNLLFFLFSFFYTSHFSHPPLILSPSPLPLLLLLCSHFLHFHLVLFFLLSTPPVYSSLFLAPLPFPAPQPSPPPLSLPLSELQRSPLSLCLRELNRSVKPRIETLKAQSKLHSLVSGSPIPSQPQAAQSSLSAPPRLNSAGLMLTYCLPSCVHSIDIPLSVNMLQIPDLGQIVVVNIS